MNTPLGLGPNADLTTPSGPLLMSETVFHTPTICFFASAFCCAHVVGMTLKRSTVMQAIAKRIVAALEPNIFIMMRLPQKIDNQLTASA
jgi:hypothetical protein